MKKNICLITSSRADFSYLSNIYNFLATKKKYKIFIIATGSHLSEKTGKTISEITKKKNIKIIQIKISDKTNSAKDITNASSQIVNKVGKSLNKKKIDLAILLGDRYEIFMCSYALKLFKIKTLHLYGGDTTIGSYDDNFRDSISLMSDYHIVSNEISKKKLTGFGIDKKKIFNFGLLSIEKKKSKKIKKKLLEKKFNFNFRKKNFLITIHPETANKKDKSYIYINNLSKIIKQFNQYSFIFTSSNLDEGGMRINEKIRNLIKKNSNTYFVKSFGVKYYFSIMEYINGVIGNSSSGILEVPSFKIPTLNIGNRQNGRIFSKSIIHVQNGTYSKILNSFKYILKNTNKFKEKKIINPYFKKNTLKNCIKLVDDILKY